MHPAAPISLLRSLPLARWTERLLEGRVELKGSVLEPCRLQAGTTTLDLVPGPVEAVLTFDGGTTPRITHLQIRCGDDTTTVSEHATDIAQALLDQLHDLALDIQVRTDGEVVVELGNGLNATLADGGAITLRAAAQGTPAAPRLAAPLQVDVADHGIRVTHGRAPGLSRVARVRVHRFALHPDGSVHLDGAGRGMLDFAVSTGLRRASDRLSALVRDSPRFERLRAFLRTSEAGSE